MRIITARSTDPLSTALAKSLLRHCSLTRTAGYVIVCVRTRCESR